MDAKLICNFLSEVAENNNREWFAAHKATYLKAKESFEQGVAEALARLSEFDSEIAHLEAKDCCYRFYRDIRFSTDKSPYKRHFGAYISAHGRKALRGGYYIHVQPGHCLLAFGCWWLPTNILTSCRNEIMANIDQWREAVENGQFVKAFGYPNAGEWTDESLSNKGFGGQQPLKTAPKGFPRDYEYLQYLKMKDYCCWRRLPDSDFEGDKWIGELIKYAKIAKPQMDFINSVVDDYE